MSPVRSSPPVEAAAPAPPLPVSPRADLDALDPLIHEIMAAWHVPGVAVGVVQDGKVVFAKGYGSRDAEQKLPVTTKTLFAIGSITKSMTVAALGTLVDEGKLDWDTPVAQYLPGFRLYDPFATERATPRDLASHMTGVPDHWFLWYGADHLTRAELIGRLRYLEPNHELRTQFEYNSLMFMVLGEMGARIAGLPNAETLITERIWKPLGMTMSNFSIHPTQKSPDFAVPYHRLLGKVVRTQFHDQDVAGPAGSVNSNVLDMARYISLQANGGTFGGRTVVAAGTMREIQRPQTRSLGPSHHPEVGEQAYALGINARTYRGHRLVRHGGGLDGFMAQIAAFPDDHVGVVVLSNLSDEPMTLAITNTILDRMIGAAPIDWRKIYFDVSTEGWNGDEAAANAPVRRHEGTHPSHALADYAGDFENPAYGAARIEADGGALRLVFHGPHALEHVHYDVFGVVHDRKDDFDRMRLVFATDADGEVVSFAMPLEPATRPMVFARGPNPAMMNERFLAPFVGEYDMGKWALRVAARGATAIVAMTPSGETLFLVPVRGTTFAIKGRTGEAVEFTPGGITLHSPDGDLSGKKK